MENKKANQHQSHSSPRRSLPRRLQRQRSAPVSARPEAHIQHRVHSGELASVQPTRLISDTTPAPSRRQKAVHSGTTKPALPRLTRSFVLRRQFNENAQTHRKKTREVKWRHAIAYVLLGVVLAAAAVIVWSFSDVVLNRIRSTVKPAETTQQPLLQAPIETNELDETAPVPEDLLISSTKMAVDEPSVIRIPRLGIESSVVRVGKSFNGEPIAPTNIYDIGWFESSGKPSGMRAVVLTGHAIGPTKPGIFSVLPDIAVGDEITAELGDGSLLSYRVERVQSYSLGELDMAAALESADPTKQALNLMVARSKYSPPDQRRTVVFAVR